MNPDAKPQRSKIRETNQTDGGEGAPRAEVRRKECSPTLGPRPGGTRGGHPQVNVPRVPPKRKSTHHHLSCYQKFFMNITVIFSYRLTTIHFTIILLCSINLFPLTNFPSQLITLKLLCAYYLFQNFKDT